MRGQGEFSHRSCALIKGPRWRPHLSFTVAHLKTPDNGSGFGLIPAGGPCEKAYQRALTRSQLLNVLGRLVALEPQQAALLDEILSGPLIDHATLTEAGVLQTHVGAAAAVVEER